MEEVLFGLALVIAVCGLFGIIASKLGQPPLVGYLIAGFLLAFLGVGFESIGELAEPFAELGIIFLLFLAGMEIIPSSLRKEGISPFIISVGQIMIVFALGFFIVFLLPIPFKSKKLYVLDR